MLRHLRLALALLVVAGGSAARVAPAVSAIAVSASSVDAHADVIGYDAMAKSLTAGFAGRGMIKSLPGPRSVSVAPLWKGVSETGPPTYVAGYTLDATNDRIQVSMKYVF